MSLGSSGRRQVSRLGASSEHILSQVSERLAFCSAQVLKGCRNPLVAVAHTGQQAIEVLEIAHRYQMNTIERTIVSRLENPNSTPEFVDLIVASRIVQSESLQEKAMKGLLLSPIIPDLNEAKRLGLDAYYAVCQSGERRGHHCRSCNTGNLYCGYCERFQ
jgi:hypothetical protein